MTHQKSSSLTETESRQLPTTKVQIAIDAVITAMRLCEQVQAEMVLTDAIQKNRPESRDCRRLRITGTDMQSDR